MDVRGTFSKVDMFLTFDIAAKVVPRSDSAKNWAVNRSGYRYL